MANTKVLTERIVARSVSTDALATLGMIHDKEEKRDAIHLAVMPVVDLTATG